MNSVSATFNGDEWAKILQNTDAYTEADATHGTLVASKGAIKVRVIDSAGQELTLQLSDVIKISKKILIDLRQTDRKAKYELHTGLQQLAQQVNLLAKKISNGATQEDAIIDRGRLLQSIREFYEGIEQIEEQLDAELIDAELIDGDFTSESEIKLQILEITNHSISSREIQRIRTLVKHNKNLLFKLSSYSESFFDIAMEKCSQESLLPLFIDILQNVKSLDKQNLAKFKSFFFNRNVRTTVFEMIMGQKSANPLFDHLLTVLTDDELNADDFKKNLVLTFAFSVTRYDYIFFKIEDVSNGTIKKAYECYQECKLEFTHSIQETYSKKGVKYYNWLTLRRGSSTTLADKGKSAREAVSRWTEAEVMRSELVKKQRGHPEQFKWFSIQQLHYKLANGEAGVSNPGQQRKGIVRTSGGWRHIYCHEDLLLQNLKTFMPWFNDGLQKCGQGGANPIIFAAQAYERLVSYHPFEGANGRLARLIMDYALEVFNLPPPVLGQDILDAVFPLDPLNHHEEAFLLKIMEGIRKSKEMLES